jgi:ADP-ribose pyrophosphatase
VEEPLVLFSGSRFRVVRRVQVTSDGKEHVRQTIEHPGAVAILPLIDRQRICLLRNYRVAVGQELVELPAGTLEPGEDPAETAARELVEETGYRARRIELLTRFYTSPGILNERMDLFLATGLEPGPQALEPGEQIETWIVSWDDALAMAGDGRIRDAKTLVGLLWGDRFLRQ